jgi:hypothetical protein
VEVPASAGRRAVCEALERRLKEALGVRVAVQAAAPGELARDTGMTHGSKPRRLLDRRS